MSVLSDLLLAVADLFDLVQFLCRHPTTAMSPNSDYVQMCRQ